MTRSLGVRLAFSIAALLCPLVTAQQTTSPDLGQLIQQRLADKVLSLRVPRTGAKLNFDESGNAVADKGRGVASLDRDIIVRQVEIRSDYVLIKGERVSYVWSLEQNDVARTPKSSPIEVEIRTAKPPAREADIAPVFRTIFLSAEESTTLRCSAEEQDAFRKYVKVSLDKKLSKERYKKAQSKPEAASKEELESICMPSGQRAYVVGKGMKPPKATSTPDPQYSEAARKAKIQGSIVYAVRVDERGVVTDVLLDRPLEASLNLNGARAISGWRFEPGTFKGEPVPVIIHVEVNFRLY